MKQNRILHLCEAPASHRFDFLCVSWCDKPTAWWRSKSLWQWRSSFQWSNVGDQFSDLCSCNCRNRLTPNTRFCIWSGICVSSDVRQRALLRLCSHSANLPAGSTLAFPHSRGEPYIVCLKQTVGPKIVTRVERGLDVGHKTKAGEYKTKEKRGNQILGKVLKSI